MDAGMRELLKKLSKTLFDRVKGLAYKIDDVGMSDSKILLFDDMVLKITPVNRASDNEIKLLRWLNGKLPVPKIIEAVTDDGYNYLLMTKLSGEMADVDLNVKALANALKMLWEIDISDCPCTNAVSEKLQQAKYNVDNDLVDPEHFDDETLGSKGFKDVADLYNYLETNRPTEDFVFSHGDFCFPNIFISGTNVTGYIDWGSGGIADRWQDIALCVRSLCYNFDDDDYIKYRALFFTELGIEPNEEKIRYYRLLDELF
jgi:Aminoglycoside phosphotransferase